MAEIMDRLRGRRGLGDKIARFGSILATGKPPVAQESEIDELIKLNQLETSSPQFRMQEAQTRADIGLQSALDIEEAKKRRAQADYDAAMNGQGQVTPGPIGMPNVASTGINSSNGPTMPVPMPGNVPQYIEIKGMPKYDPSIGRMVPGESKFEKNLDYLSPEDRRAENERETMLKQTAEQNLHSIQEAKKGAKYFGPMGDLPSWAVPSSIPVIGKATTGDFSEIRGEYGDRQEWENNINKLLSQKVVDLITQMKSASKTGATGFGQLSEKEGAILREASTALNKKLLPEQAVYYLNEMENIQRKFLNMPPVEQSQPETTSTGVPAVGQTFQGKPIKSVRRIG